MRIGLIGAGNIGTTLATILVRAGHEVAISNSRGPASLQAFADTLGTSAQAVSVEEAAGFGDLAIESIPFRAIPSLPGDALRGRILVSASNCIPRRDGEIDLEGLTHTEYVARQLPATRVVKCFNTITWQHLGEQGDTSAPLQRRRVIPIAADDEEAAQRVAALVASLGFGPLYTGSLAQSWLQQPGFYNRNLALWEAVTELEVAGRR